MRKNIFSMAVIALLFSSCAQMVAPPYTKVESIVRITPGMTASEVSSTLGIPPFDVFHMSGDGSTLHMYYYKLKERKNTGCGLYQKMPWVDPFYSQEQNLAVGNSYYTKEEKLYVLFKNGKVASMITDAGREESEDLLVQNNTIQFIAKTDRTALMYEKLEMGQQLVKLDTKGHFDKKRNDSILGGAKIKSNGCLGGCMGK